MTKPPEARWTTALLFGGIAGFVATAAMTSAMTRWHRALPERERYPLPPREITERMFGGENDALLRDGAMAAHFLYGAAAGAVIARMRPRLGLGEGALAGLAVWAGSYFGWVPGVEILRPATAHPARRNKLMVGAHLVWGSCTALVLNELFEARSTILADGPLRDANGARTGRSKLA